MQEDADLVRQSRLDYWLARSWTGYGLVAIGVAFLALGTDSVQKVIGWPGVGMFNFISGLAILACLGLLATSAVAKLVIVASGRKIQIEPRKKYARIAGFCLAIGFAGFMLSLILPASVKARRAAQEASLTTFQLGDGSVAIELPATFQRDPDASIRQGFAASDPLRDLTVIAYANHSSDLIADTPQSYAVQVRENLLSNFPDGKPSEIEELSVGQIEVLRQTFEYDDSGLRYVNTVDVRMAGDWLVDIRFISPPSRLESWQPEMARITKSARLEDTE